MAGTTVEMGNSGSPTSLVNRKRGGNVSIMEELDTGSSNLSWRDRVSPRAMKPETVEIGYTAPQIVNGVPYAKIQSNDVNSKKWSTAVIAQVIGMDPSFLAFKGYAESKWRTRGLLDIQRTLPGLFVLRFQGEEERQRALEMSPLMYGNKALYLRPWTPENSITKMEISALPIWVKLDRKELLMPVCVLR